MMLSSLLGVLVLMSPCSALIRPNATDTHSSREFRTSLAPNTRTHTVAVVTPPLAGGAGRDSPMLDASSSADLPVPDPTPCDWLLNAPVPVPVQQVPVHCLCSHCRGREGPKGAQGDCGPPGAAGSPGGRGPAGFRGHPGDTGPPGVKGQKGQLGGQGDAGAAGLPGTKGGRGLKGDPGDRGLMGPAGALGPEGETGECPASCGPFLGPPGPQGVSGPAGTRGLPGVQGLLGSKGLKGERGDVGGPGSPGLTGQKGGRGHQGGCECTDAEDGTDGTAGGAGDKGADGNPGNQGSKGSMGVKGTKGEPGVRGPPGPCSPVFQSAFSACINQSFPVHNLPVPFPRVLSNQQGHFDPVRGVYTAPVNGTYVFSFHLAVHARALKVGLFRNFYPYVRVTEGTDGSTSSQWTTLRLMGGDQVWLQVKDASTNGLYTNGERSSTFSGFLLQPESCSQARGGPPVPGGTPPEEGYSWEGPERTATSSA